MLRVNIPCYGNRTKLHLPGVWKACFCPGLTSRASERKWAGKNQGLPVTIFGAACLTNALRLLLHGLFALKSHRQQLQNDKAAFLDFLRLQHLPKGRRQILHLVLLSREILFFYC